MASFDNSTRPELLLFWMWGIWTMVFLHNFCISILLYKNRNQNASNFIKIIFNFMGLAKALFGVVSFITPDDVSDAACQTIGYLLGFNNAFFRMSLSAFLLWRIKQIEFKKYDLCIGFILFVITSSLQISRTFVLPLHAVPNKLLNQNFCFGPSVAPESYSALYYTSISVDFTIDLFVTCRLIQILRRANKNAHFVTSNMRKPFKRTLFTSVMYWNFLRLALSFIYQVITVVQINVYFSHIYTVPAIFTVVFVLLSYVITADAEIVRVIEGRNPESGKGDANGSAGTDKPHKRFGFRHVHTTSTDTEGPTEYVISAPSFNLTSPQQTEKIDTDTNNAVASSMKRLSFFEWAKFVVGKKDKNETKNLNNEKDSMEEIEEKFPDNTDFQYEVSVTKEETRRESDHSLATTVIDPTMSFPKGSHV